LWKETATVTDNHRARAFLRAKSATVRAALALCGFLACAPAAGQVVARGELEARRQEIAALSPADRQELLRKQERFAALPPEEQDRLRALEAAIEADPKSARLRQVLVGYHDWLKTLSFSERAELAELPPDERVERIKESLRRQEIRRQHEQRVELLTPRDMRSILNWIEDIAWRQRDDLIAAMSPRMRSWFDKENDDRKRRALLHVAFDRTRKSGGRSRLDIREDDLERLAKRLSEPAQAELARQPDFDARRKLVRGWVFSSMIERSESGRSSRRSTPLPEADVAQFFEELSPRKRDELMSLPPNKAREELRRMYWQRDRDEPIFRPGPGGPGSERRREGPRGDGPWPEGRGPDAPRGEDPPPPGPPPDAERDPQRAPPPGDRKGRPADRSAPPQNRGAEEALQELEF
jgi:hypothetical protein